MDFVGPSVSVIDKYLIAPFLISFKYMTSSKDNTAELRSVLGELQATRNDKQHKLQAEAKAGRVKTDVASNWFEAVSQIEKEAVDIEKKLEETGCMNCWSRYKLSKRSAELTQKAKESLYKQIALTREPSLETAVEMPIEPETTEIRPSTEIILDCIKDPEIEIIGVCGMGGVGKTTLAKQVNNYFKKNPCFDTVIMVTVSATPNMKIIQTRIGKRLGLDLAKDYSEHDAKEKLFDVLRTKKFLLIFDDVWPKSKFNIEDVGIPHPGMHEHNSKIMVTSRSKDVCTDMGAARIILVHPLSEDESWNLFVEIVSRHVDVAGIECFARKIVKKCKGLPLAIVTVARTMANRHDVGEWENAVREMEQSITNLRGMKDKVFDTLKFSFDSLEDEMLKGLFLYCACFPEYFDIWKEETLAYCVGNGLVDTLGSLTATRNKCEALIGSLKIACMLEDREYDPSVVRMHDMFRELGIWIIRSSGYLSDSISPNKVLIRSGRSLIDAPEAHEWSDATWISLMDTQIEKLPELGPMCPKLTTLLLSSNETLTVIPPTNFFQHMNHLSVLDLSMTKSLKSLPDSLSCLVSLRVLMLYNCVNLEVLPALGMLQQLQVLDLWGCESLHRQILNSECVEGLRNLRHLDVAHSNVSFQRGAISHLRLLEELKISEMKWRVSDEDNEEEESGFSSTNSILDVKELSNLTNLTYLHIQYITISDWFKPLANKVKRLELINCKVKQDALEALNGSQNLRGLEMQGCSGVTCLPTCNIASKVIIEDCKDLEKVMDEAMAYHHPDSFTVLSLIGLPNLKRIIGNSNLSLSPINCFGHLKLISIVNCHRLKMVFTKEMPRLFNNLEDISIVNCDEIEVILEEGEEVVVGQESVGSTREIIRSPFPRLKHLYLEDLAALHDVCSSNQFLHCPLIEEVEVFNCPKLNKDTLAIQNASGFLLVVNDGFWWKKRQLG